MTQAPPDLTQADGFEDEYDDWSDIQIDDTYLTFHLAGSEYAVAVSVVKEIVRLPPFTEVPDVPPFIRGVINLRGQVIPLMDTRMRLGLEPVEYNDRTVAIVLETDGVPTGLVADGVNGVEDIPPAQIAPPPNRTSRSSGTRAVKGIGRTDSSVSIILDACTLLGADEIEPVSTIPTHSDAP